MARLQAKAKQIGGLIKETFVYATRFGTRIERTKNAVLAAESKGNDEGSGAWRVSKSSS
jgi:hypothetical protein